MGHLAGKGFSFLASFLYFHALCSRTLCLLMNDGNLTNQCISDTAVIIVYLLSAFALLRVSSASHSLASTNEEQ